MAAGYATPATRNAGHAIWNLSAIQKTKRFNTHAFDLITKRAAAAALFVDLMSVNLFYGTRYNNSRCACGPSARGERRTYDQRQGTVRIDLVGIDAGGRAAAISSDRRVQISSARIDRDFAGSGRTDRSCLAGRSYGSCRIVKPKRRH